MSTFKGLTVIDTATFLGRERSWIYLAIAKLKPGYKVKGIIESEMVYELFDYSFSARGLDSLNFQALNLSLSKVKEDYTQAITEVKNHIDLLPLIAARKTFRPETSISNILVYIRRIQPKMEKVARTFFPSYIKQLAYRKFVKGKLDWEFFVGKTQPIPEKQLAIDFIKKQIRKQFYF